MNDQTVRTKKLLILSSSHSTIRAPRGTHSAGTNLNQNVPPENVAELSGMFDRQGSLSPNSIVLQGESPLHISVRKDRVHSTKVLLDQGADVNLQVIN